MAEHHEHGTMDIDVQEKTFDGFMKFVVRGGISIVIALIVLALIGA